MKDRGLYSINFLIILGLLGVLFMGFWVEFFLKQEPCSLCFLQRNCMMVIACSLYFNLFFGLATPHYALALLGSLVGMTTSLRHIALHVCKSASDPGFVFGPYHLYTWAFLTFFLVLVGISFLLFFHEKKREGQAPKFFISIAKWLLYGVVILGALSMLLKKGWAL